MQGCIADVGGRKGSPKNQRPMEGFDTIEVVSRYRKNGALSGTYKKSVMISILPISDHSVGSKPQV